MTQRMEARVPDIGSDKGVPVIELLVKVGETVSKDQGLVTLESDKATMEVPAPYAGIIRELAVKVGDEINTGALVAIIEQAADAAPVQADLKPAATTASPPATPAAPTTAPAAPVAAPAAPTTATAAPVAAPAAPTTATAAPVAAPAAPTTASAAPVAAPAPSPREEVDTDASRADAQSAKRAPPVPEVAGAPGSVPYASPAVRVFARELGVDLSRVTGSERGGRIGKPDVQAFVKMQLQAATAARVDTTVGNGLQLIAWPRVDFAKFGEVQLQARTRINKISAANLARNWAMIPHVTQHDEADVSGMEAFRKTLGEEHKGVKITPLVFLIMAVVAALKKHPTFNASLDGDNLVLKKYFHIGIAVDTPDGLMVPVLRDCDRKGLLELSTELAAISAKAREGKLAPGDMQGGCFSISSLGGIGGTAFTPIINAPEVAILGVSRSQTKPVWDGSQFAPRLMLPLSLSYDHRVIDGAGAARFCAYLSQLLGDLRRLLV